MLQKRKVVNNEIAWNSGFPELHKRLFGVFDVGVMLMLDIQAIYSVNDTRR